MTIALSIGHFGGFYIRKRGYVRRLCLGWVAFDYYPREIDLIIRDLIEEIHSHSNNAK